MCKRTNVGFSFINDGILSQRVLDLPEIFGTLPVYTNLVHSHHDIPLTTGRLNSSNNYNLPSPKNNIYGKWLILTNGLFSCLYGRQHDGRREDLMKMTYRRIRLPFLFLLHFYKVRPKIKISTVNCWL